MIIVCYHQHHRHRYCRRYHHHRYCRRYHHQCYPHQHHHRRYCRRYCRQLGWALALLPRTPQGARAELTLPLPTRPFPIETTVEFRSQPSHPDEHSTTALQHQLRRELYLLTRRHSGN